MKSWEQKATDVVVVICFGISAAARFLDPASGMRRSWSFIALQQTATKDVKDIPSLLSWLENDFVPLAPTWSDLSSSLSRPLVSSAKFAANLHWLLAVSTEAFTDRQQYPSVVEWLP